MSDFAKELFNAFFHANVIASQVATTQTTTTLIRELPQYMK